MNKTIDFEGKPLKIRWTKRAERVLSERDQPLYIEMQIFFSCVVKKRVLFHDVCEHHAIPVNDNMFVLIRPVEAASCDPVEFANNYPERRELESSRAMKMRASSLSVDFVDGEWVGEFLI